MKFIAKQPREGINVSKTHPLVEASTLVVGLALIFIVVALSLIFLIELSLLFVSAEKEAELFSGWTPEDLVTAAQNDERLDDVQDIVDRLVVHWPDSTYQFRVEVDASELPNAMAMPGGLIVVTQGLLDQVESENELAFVLGHELGHFKNRDHLRALGRGVVLSLLFTTITGSDVSGMGVKIADLTIRGFSRRQESAADQFGLTVVNAEFGHVAEAWRLFDRWDSENAAKRDFVTYLSTHPDTGDRIANMKLYAATQMWRAEGSVTPLSWVDSSTILPKPPNE